MSTSDDQAAKVTEALRHLRGEPAQLVNTAGHPVPLAEGPGGGLRATTAPVGRVIVGPAQSVDPDTWGNVVYDQTMMTFASEITRDQQWPNPLEGARCYLMNQQRPYLFRNGRWRSESTGLYRTNTGPASAMSGSVILTSVNPVMLPAGSRYLCEATANASISGAAGGIAPSCRLSVASATVNTDTYLWRYPSTPTPVAAWAVGGYAVTLLTAPPTVGLTVSVMVRADGSNQSFAVNAARLIITDQGGPP